MENINSENNNLSPAHMKILGGHKRSTVTGNPMISPKERASNLNLEVLNHFNFDSKKFIEEEFNLSKFNLIFFEFF